MLIYSSKHTSELCIADIVDKFSGSGLLSVQLLRKEVTSRFDNELSKQKVFSRSASPGILTHDWSSCFSSPIGHCMPWAKIMMFPNISKMWKRLSVSNLLNCFYMMIVMILTGPIGIICFLYQSLPIFPLGCQHASMQVA